MRKVMLKLPYSWKTLVCLNHSHLIIKKLTLPSEYDTWLTRCSPASYLTERRQLVEVKHTNNGKTETVSSTKIQISRGIPLGSVLGPAQLLFTNNFSSYKQD